MEVFKRINELPDINLNKIDNDFYMILDKNQTGSSVKVSAKDFLEEISVVKPPLEEECPEKYWVRKDGKWIELFIGDGTSNAVSQSYVDNKIRESVDREMSDTSQNSVQNRIVKEYIDKKFPNGDILKYGDTAKY